ncbi:MAG: DUF1772 domain-containing protein [Planctomycetales bacterium]|nr:DUF1772 domain-containing protein [Planctomycetales bacterium]
MTILLVVLILATLLCSLVAGFVLLFAIVVMPGLATLPDREFLRAFQVIDRVIQNNQPLFMLVWIGSAVTLLVAAGLGVWQLEGINRMLFVVAAALYIVGVQLPTMAINLPLNNRVKTLRLETLDETLLASERGHFESRWNRWNVIRSVAAILSSVTLLTLVRII